MFGDRTIDPNTQFARRLIEFTKSVITALPSARPLGFHAEIFHTPEDELLLCEIAARTPGSITGEAIEHSYGINIHRAWIRSLAGLDDNIAPARTPRQYTASIRIPIREGRLVSLPTVIPFPWVSTCCLTGVVGKAYDRATTYTDDVLSALVAGSSETQLEERIAELATWLNEVIRWA